MDVKIVTFNNMHNIICELVDDVDGSCKVKNALYIIQTQDKSGKMQISFHPFNDYSQEYESGIPIFKQNILCVTTPVVELLNIYNNVFSKIQLASPSSMASVSKIR